MTRKRFVILLALAAAAGLLVLGLLPSNEAPGGCGCEGTVETIVGAYSFEYEGREYPVDVYRVAESPRGGVLLLHEMPGMTPASICLAKRLAVEGYVVHMPLLFGDRGDDNALANGLRSTFHPGFQLLSTTDAVPISAGLEPVLKRLAADVAGRPIAVIGMCLTGAVPLDLLTDARVAAGVLSQPALPLFNGDQLGISRRQLDAVRATGRPILAHRFEGDGFWSPRERLDRLSEEFRGQIETHDFPGDGHSVLAADCREENLAHTLRFLRRALPEPASEAR